MDLSSSRVRARPSPPPSLLQLVFINVIAIAPFSSMGNYYLGVVRKACLPTTEPEVTATT